MDSFRPRYSVPPLEARDLSRWRQRSVHRSLARRDQGEGGDPHAVRSRHRHGSPHCSTSSKNYSEIIQGPALTSDLYFTSSVFQYEHGLIAQPELRDPDRVTLQQFQGETRSVVHLFQTNHPWRMAEPFRNSNKIRIGREKRKIVAFERIPRSSHRSSDRQNRGLSGAPSREGAPSGKEFGKYRNQFGRQIKIDQKLQRAICPRISATAVRVPRTMGWPERTSGSIVIRLSESTLMTEY